MNLREIIPLVEGTALCNTRLDVEITCVCAADLMSDVLAFAEPSSLLLTGLCNPQVVRTAEMADIAGVIFVRGKRPSSETVALAEEKNIPLVLTSLTMFETCGRLYQTGLRSCNAQCRMSLPCE